MFHYPPHNNNDRLDARRGISSKREADEAMTCAQRASRLEGGVGQCGWWDGGNPFRGRWKREKLIRRENRGQSQEPASPWRGSSGG